MLNINEKAFDVFQYTLGYRDDHTIKATTKFINSKLGNIAVQLFVSVNETDEIFINVL